MLCVTQLTRSWPPLGRPAVDGAPLCPRCIPSPHSDEDVKATLSGVLPQRPGPGGSFWGCCSVSASQAGLPALLPSALRHPAKVPLLGDLTVTLDNQTTSAPQCQLLLGHPLEAARHLISKVPCRAEWSSPAHT